MIHLDLDVSLAETGSSSRDVNLCGPKRHGSATLWRGVDANVGSGGAERVGDDLTLPETNIAH